VAFEVLVERVVFSAEVARFEMPELFAEVELLGHAAIAAEFACLELPEIFAQAVASVQAETWFDEVGGESSLELEMTATLLQHAVLTAEAALLGRPVLFAEMVALELPEIFAQVVAPVQAGTSSDVVGRVSSQIAEFEIPELTLLELAALFAQMALDECAVCSAEMGRLWAFELLAHFAVAFRAETSSDEGG